MFEFYCCFFKQKSAYERRISDWSSDVCSSDLHGGPEKALHHFPARNYALFAPRFPEIAAQFVPGSIGENFSTDEWTEEEVCIGDVYALGSARIQLNQPRSPCWKIDARYGVDGLTQFVADQGVAGWYYRVQIGRASGRERECQYVSISVVAVKLKKK